MNYKEFFGRYQHTAEGRTIMGQQQEEALKKAKYEQSYELSKVRQSGLSYEQYRAERSTQIHQLYNAYVEASHGSHNAGVRDAYETSEDAVRRVTGQNRLYNNKPYIALDSTDIAIISQIAIRSHQGYTNSVGAFSVESIVNNVEILKYIAEQTTHENIDIGRLLKETDVLSTEMAKTSREYNSQTYGQYAQYHPQPKGFFR